MKTSQDFEGERETPNFKSSTARQIWALVKYYNCTFKECAERLSLSYDYIRQVASQYRIFRFKNDSEDTSQKIVRSTCLECGGQVRKIDAELVCFDCGLATPILDAIHRLPFSSSYSHSSNMAFGKSLGSKIGDGRRGLFQVLAKSIGDREDLGLRARQIRVIQTSNDPPQTKKLLGCDLRRPLRCLRSVSSSSGKPVSATRENRPSLRMEG